MNKESDFRNLKKAIEDNDINQLKYLHENDTNIMNIVDNDGYTPLMHAITYTNIDCIIFIYENCSNIHNINSNGNNALLIALFYLKYSGEDFYDDYINLIQIIKYLLENGADINIVNNQGKSAIDLAFNEEINKIISEYSIINGYVLK